MGDLHGNFNTIIPNLKNKEIENAVLIFCGDVGIGFRREEYYEEMFTKLSKLLAEANNQLVFFRGNHDKPKYYDGKHFISELYPNIHVVPDYTVLSINGGERNILCLGGAISVDRFYRRQWNNDALLSHSFYKGESKDKYVPQCFWEDETIVYNKCKINCLTEDGFKIDTICSHTSPIFTYPTEKGSFVEHWAKRDVMLLDDLDAERNTMSNILNDLLEKGHPITKWYYGHFHQHHEEEINGISYTLLDQCNSGKLDIIKL